MKPEDEGEIARAMREAIRLSRGYADSFGWAPNRDLEEAGVLVSLAESLEKDDALFFGKIKTRGRGSDPPDLEAPDCDGKRIAFEMTELVDGAAIQAFKDSKVYEPDWSRDRFIESLEKLLRAKDSRLPKLKDPPYEGGYIVVVFTDEPDLPANVVEQYLDGHTFVGLPHISQAYLLISYDPGRARCPYFALNVGA